LGKLQHACPPVSGVNRMLLHARRRVVTIFGRPKTGRSPGSTSIRSVMRGIARNLVMIGSPRPLADSR
jgi:hypothetical protein